MSNPEASLAIIVQCAARAASDPSEHSPVCRAVIDYIALETEEAALKRPLSRSLNPQSETPSALPRRCRRWSLIRAESV